MDRRPGRAEGSESRMPVLKLTEASQAAQLSEQGGTGEAFAKESELKMLSDIGNLPP